MLTRREVEAIRGKEVFNHGLDAELKEGGLGLGVKQVGKDLVGEDGEGILEERGDKKGGIAYLLSHDAWTISAFSGGGEEGESRGEIGSIKRSDRNQMRKSSTHDSKFLCGDVSFYLL
jgi:hypothetical protein